MHSVDKNKHLSVWRLNHSGQEAFHGFQVFTLGLNILYVSVLTNSLAAWKPETAKETAIVSVSTGWHLARDSKYWIKTNQYKKNDETRKKQTFYPLQLTCTWNIWSWEQLPSHQTSGTGTKLHLFAIDSFIQHRIIINQHRNVKNTVYSKHTYRDRYLNFNFTIRKISGEDPPTQSRKYLINEEEDREREA